MLNALFNGKYWILHGIPFSLLVITMEDGRKLVAKKDYASGRQARLPNTETPDLGVTDLQLLLITAGGEDHKYVVKRLSRDDPRFKLIESEVPGLERVGSSTWQDLRTGESLDLEQMLFRYGDRLGIPKEDEPKWLLEVRQSCKIHLIDTSRLLTIQRIPRLRRRDVPRSFEPAVEVYSHRLAMIIEETLAEYAALSQNLDQSFPERLIKNRASKKSNPEAVIEKLRKLGEKRARLAKAGILGESIEDMARFLPIELDDVNTRVLEVYVNDTENKLGMFDDIVARIELFMDIVNARFVYKTVRVNRGSGFVLQLADGKPLVASKLSSGEQHVLVMMYELLFETEKSSIVLIDEPEISLHVGWQSQFLSDLQRITQLRDFDAILATHSPQIVGDRWDLVVPLKGPMK
jgi:hypothetical protein